MLGTGDFFDFPLGDMHITALCDMSFAFGRDYLTGASAEALDRHLPDGSAAASCTAYLVRLNGMVVLVDAGAGGTFDGQMHDALAKAGVAPGQIDHILLTHLHLDHVGGLLHDGKPVFSRAKVWLAEAEYAFWQDDAATAKLAERLRPALGEGFIPTHVKVARSSLAVYDGQLRLFSGDREIIPGITPVPLYGHTPGHCGYVLGGEAKTFFYLGRCGTRRPGPVHPARSGHDFRLGRGHGGGGAQEGICYGRLKRLAVSGNACAVSRNGWHAARSGGKSFLF